MRTLLQIRFIPRTCKHRTDYEQALLVKEQIETTTPSNYECIGAAMTAELMTELWFDVEVISAVRIVDNLDYCGEARMISR